jgi:acetoin utilization protein AcuA
LQTLSSPYGPIELWPCAAADSLRHLLPDASLNAFRSADLQFEALVSIADDIDGCLTFARLEQWLIGYAAFHPPDAIERWSQCTEPGLLELGAIETSRNHRSRHLARRLLEVAFATGRFEDKIVLATLYHWHYDLEGTGLSTYAYRRLLERLYGSVGFVALKTDDPEIAYYPGNSLMARIGPRAPAALQAEFLRLRFLDGGQP